MKDERGITLISLITYVILLILVVAVASNITASFYSNMNEFNNESEDVVSYTRFNMYFLNDIKRKDVTIVDYQDNYIILSYAQDGEQKQAEYSLQNNSIYRNKIKICDNVSQMHFSVGAKNTIQIITKIGDYEKNTTYVIENYEDTNNI